MKRTVVGLLVLSVIPLLGGLLRLAGLLGAASVEGHEPFAAHPVPAVLHIVSATTFATLGALQFSTSLRRTRWHALAGRVLTLVGVVAVASGSWMVLTWPPKPLDSASLSAMRFVVAVAMAGSLGLGFLRAREKNLSSHEAWMTRAFALGAGAGTQALLLIPAMRVPSLQTQAGHAFLMGAGWLLNLLVAEWALVARRADHLAEVAS